MMLTKLNLMLCIISVSWTTSTFGESHFIRVKLETEIKSCGADGHNMESNSIEILDNARDIDFDSLNNKTRVEVSGRFELTTGVSRTLRTTVRLDKFVHHFNNKYYIGEKNLVSKKDLSGSISSQRSAYLWINLNIVRGENKYHLSAYVATSIGFGDSCAIVKSTIKDITIDVQ